MSRRKKLQRTSGETTKPKPRGKSRRWGGLLALGTVVSVAGALFWAPSMKKAGASPEITVYKSASCGCCGKWVDHLRDEGFSLSIQNRNDMDQIKSSLGVKRKLWSCHTAKVDGYVLEGHVPADDIRRLLRERPAVAGLAVPGMPMGSPGMEGKYKDPYEVLTFTEKGKTGVYTAY